MDKSSVTSKYFEQLGKENAADKTKGIEAVFAALEPMFDLPATPENFWQAKRVAFNAKMATYVDEKSSPVWKFLIGAFTGGGDAVSEHFKAETLKLQETEHYFLEVNNITDPKAIEAVKRGDATIGELFSLQPSIFC